METELPDEIGKLLFFFGEKTQNGNMKRETCTELVIKDDSPIKVRAISQRNLPNYFSMYLSNWNLGLN